MSRDIEAKEREFHDRWASGTAVDELPVEAFFEAPTAMENRFILLKMGDLKGKSLLDVGCGLGESSVYFAKQGAQVSATDLSPGMIETTTQLAAQHGVALHTVVSNAERIAMPDESFDIIYVANTIHHVEDRGAFLQEIKRLLKPGGVFFAWDPIAYNPLINLYRRMASEVRTEDEKPLGWGDIRLMRQFFPDLQFRTFWFSSLLLFLKYYVVDRVHPNQDRYWKRIYRSQSLWWWKPLSWMDRHIWCHVPGFRWWGWNVVVWGRKGEV